LILMKDIVKDQTVWTPGNHFGVNLPIHFVYEVDFSKIKEKNGG
jgi:hypothetical protein